MPSIQRILVSVDFSEACDRVLDYAIELASRLRAHVTVLHVFSLPVYNFPDGSFVPTAEVADRVGQAARQQLDAVVERRRSQGVELTGVLRSGSPGPEICAVATEVGADLIVVGTHGRGVVGRALLGSVANTVVRSATQPVLTLRYYEST